MISAVSNILKKPWFEFEIVVYKTNGDNRLIILKNAIFNQTQKVAVFCCVQKVR